MRFVVQVDGRLTQNDRPCRRGDVIELPPGVAKQFGRELVVPEGDAEAAQPEAKP